MRRVWPLALVTISMLGACSDDETTPASPRSSTSTSVTTTTSTPRASASLTFAGDAGPAGAPTRTDVRCGFPNLDGPSIAMLATAADPTLQLRIAVTSDKLTVHAAATNGTEYHERAFESTGGVTGFAADTGAVLDATLTEIPATPGSTPGSVGAVTSVKGTVDCAGQDPGTSSITVTGETAEGTLTAATLESARVECYLPGDEVIVQGILRVGSSKAFMEYGLRPEGTNVHATLETGAELRYQAAPGSATLTGTGAHVSGDATEQQGTTPPRTLHLEGDVTCGDPIG